MVRITIGDRFYRWVNDTIEEVKVLKIAGSATSDNCKVKYLSSETKQGDTENITRLELSTNYTKLKPDGYVTFNIVNVGNGISDVMVTLSRTKDVEKGDQIPYAVCRQCINDLFASQVKKFSDEFFGISISKETCPMGVEFHNFLACNGSEKTDTVSMYIGDNLTDILKLIKTKDYDIALYNLFSDRCKYVSNGIKYIYNLKMQNTYIDGYCKTLKDLLISNNFLYDMCRAFNIIPVRNLEIGKCVGNELNIVARKRLSDLICKNIDKSIVIQYDKSIDLAKIERDYLLVEEDSNIYVVGYTESGTYHIPVENVESKESISKLNDLYHIDDIHSAYKKLSFDTAKYDK